MTAEEIMKKLEADERNRSYTERGIHPVFQVSTEARILIIGQAPGRKVEASGIPFDDKSGETLICWLGINRQIFYSSSIAIVPMDFYYPGKGKTGDLPPRRFVAGECHPAILSMMKEIQLTVLVGRYAMAYYLKDTMKKTLTETVASYQQYLPAYFPIVHPSPLNYGWLKRNPWFEEKTVADLQQTVHRILAEGKSAESASLNDMSD